MKTHTLVHIWVGEQHKVVLSCFIKYFGRNRYCCLRGGLGPGQAWAHPSPQAFEGFDSMEKELGFKIYYRRVLSLENTVKKLMEKLSTVESIKETLAGELETVKKRLEVGERKIMT